MAVATLPGQSFPLGATVYSNGVNFSLFSKNCDYIELLLFDDDQAPQPSRVIRFDPKINRTFYYWHIFIPKLKAGQVYAYRVYGPNEPDKGYRFNGEKVLIDPYTRAVVSHNYSRQAAIQPGDNCAQSMRGVVVDNSDYDWEGDTPLQIPYSKTVIYELHVAGFTRHPSSGVAPELRGTYAGLIEKIPYLIDLGVTAVELLPVSQYDPQDSPHGVNYWGYSPIGFFAPHSGYSSRRDPLGPVNEFRDMVKALHKAGIEVILDIVFNHSAEGNQHGPTLSFRGLENRAYYILANDPQYYMDYSGCGNTLNANQSIVRRMIMDCLRYWVAEMHVDGFRFDLASVLARDEWGQPLKSPPILWEIESDPVLAGTKIIAEAWDAGGLYQVGSFIGHRWAEWNGKFRDDMRRFIKGDPGSAGSAAQRVVGSPDLYPQSGREPNRSINFITCHDGFTLNDLVSYNDKHNEANGEDNRDGNNTNFSWNSGVEGVTVDPAIEALRLRQIKNFYVALLVSQGTPMLMMGDEVRRSQNGNNNAYCQDNEISWFNWELVNQNQGLLDFVRGLIQFTQTHPIFYEHHFWTGTLPESRITWHGIHLLQGDWSENSHSLSFTLHHTEDKEQIHIILNAYWDALTFDLPPLGNNLKWHRIADTALNAPDDFCPEESSPVVDNTSYRVEARASIVLLAK